MRHRPILFAQQKDAYAELASDRGLAIVTGVAGAGKSRADARLRARPKREAGVRVIGTAVAGDAALTWAKKRKIETRNLAQLLADLRPGPDGTRAAIG